jgi:hypothetical protein
LQAEAFLPCYRKLDVLERQMRQIDAAVTF